MFNVLQARGIPSRFVMFPDESHVRVAPHTPPPPSPAPSDTGQKGLRFPVLTLEKHSGSSNPRTLSSGITRLSTSSTSSAASKRQPPTAPRSLTR